MNDPTLPPAPIVCPSCESINWRRSWSGRFYEEQHLTWQTHSTHDYLLTFDNEDQHDTDTEPWICASCGMQPDDDTAALLETRV